VYFRSTLSWFRNTMPIYAYKCSECGHAKDVLQKISDAPLTVCPSCGKAAFSKQITAPQFQLKGSGWYVTDFRGGSGTTGKPGSVESAASESKEAKGDTPAPAADSKPATTETKPAPAAGTPAPAKTPAAE
jgi:putative FmdB family regulatory protein